MEAANTASGPSTAAMVDVGTLTSELDLINGRLGLLTAASSATGYDGRIVRATGELVACAAELVQAAMAREPESGATEPPGRADSTLCAAIEGLERTLRRLRWVRSVHVDTSAQNRFGRETRSP
ncbi:hypothetical protein [Actinomadura sp. 7K534]|uniref:hypothetical protein n=1 Tax=Actinomadura sp. 7K534 TaxID=2530366 RepID=UPI0010459083|nr:hypothetical protein [Actinomadura sp. 7K534]TDB97930.1 hypothetical protein E1266_04915 [Actinomadura sp. 7K534]